MISFKWDEGAHSGGRGDVTNDYGVSRIKASSGEWYDVVRMVVMPPVKWSEVMKHVPYPRARDKGRAKIIRIVFTSPGNDLIRIFVMSSSGMNTS